MCITPPHTYTKYSTDYDIKFRLMNAPKLLSFHYFICKFFLPSFLVSVYTKVLSIWTQNSRINGIKSAKNMKPQYCYKTVALYAILFVHTYTLLFYIYILYLFPIFYLLHPLGIFISNVIQ